MKIRNFVFILTLATALPAAASKVTVGPAKDGQQMYKVEGCDTLRNITGNLNGYAFEPKLDWDHDIWICGNLDLEGESMLSILKKIASLTPDCFNFGIDEAQKKVSLLLGPGLRSVKIVTESRAIYEVDGHVKLIEPSDSTKEIKICVLHPESVEAPFDQILK
jgi:hypothetical protein